MKTFQAKPNEVPREWVLVDMDGKTLGRAASSIARILRGKNKPQFTPHVDTGDFVVAINCQRLQLTGRKLDQKRYYRHTLYPGGLRSATARELVQTNPEAILKSAVKGMPPKNSLGRSLIKKLKTYSSSEHPHAAQKPKVVEI